MLMLKLVGFLCFCTFFGQGIYAQATGETVWAHSVEAFSSQYQDKAYGAKQVLGPPNALPTFGISPVAWCPAKKRSRMPEYLRVGFEKGIFVQQILIGENAMPGHISSITLYDNFGKAHVVFKNPNPKPLMLPGRLWHLQIERTDYRVMGLKINFDTRQSDAYIQIDCIGLMDGMDKVVPKINSINYESSYSGLKENLGPNINTEYDEKSPIISPDGKSLYFTRKLSPENTGASRREAHPDNRDDVYVSHLLPNGVWSKARNIGKPINDEGHNFACAVTPGGRQLLIGQGSHKTGKQGVAFYNRTATGYKESATAAIANMYNNNEYAHYHLSVDGNVLLMAVEREEGFGDMDLFVSFKQSNNQWTEPKNLGSTINTAGTEPSVFLGADGKTLYFSSNGHPGYGSYDMFVSRRLDNTWQKWSEPKNLGHLINTREGDFFYTIPAKGDYAYFSSQYDRFGQATEFADIFRIPLPQEAKPEPTQILSGRIVDEETGEPVKAEIITRDRDGFKANEIETIEGISEFQIILPVEERLSFSIEVPGYFPVGGSLDIEEFDEDNYGETPDQISRIETLDPELIEMPVDLPIPELPDKTFESIDTISLEDEIREKLRKEIEEEFERKLKDSIAKIVGTPDPPMDEGIDMAVPPNDSMIKDPEFAEIEKDIRLVPIKEGKIIQLENIFFDADKANLKSVSYEELNRLVDFLEQNPGMTIEIRGHTNGLPAHAYCDKLSQARAKRVYQYLVHKGIKRSRLEFKGYGKREPLTTNDTLEGRKKNQRVEIKILSLD